MRDLVCLFVFTCCQPLLRVHQLTVFIFTTLTTRFVLHSGPQGKYMDIEFDFKGDPLGGVISNCKSDQCCNVATENITRCWHASSLLVVIYMFRRGAIFDFPQAVNCERLCSGPLTSEPSDVVWWFLLCGLKLCLVTGLFQKVFLCSFRLITL